MGQAVRDASHKSSTCKQSFHRVDIVSIEAAYMVCPLSGLVRSLWTVRIELETETKSCYLSPDCGPVVLGNASMVVIKYGLVQDLLEAAESACGCRIFTQTTWRVGAKEELG